MANEFSYDLVILGGGSGGYAAARTARDLGATVAIVDQGPLGGLCILRGCMPSKTLIATGDMMHAIREAHALGIDVGEPHVDYKRLMQRKREIIKGFADYRIEGLETFPIYPGRAHFVGPTTLAVGESILHGKNIIVATGSSVAPAVLPGLAETGFVDSDDVLDRDDPPRSVIVLGGGYVGSELGQFMSRVGVKTTILVRSGHVLSGEDTDVGMALTNAMRAEGIEIHTGATLVRAERRGDAKVVHYMVGGEAREAVADEIFYALGRVPNVEGIDLEAAGIAVHPITGIVVDETLRTNNPHVFAIGDVIGAYPLVHVAIQQGEVAAKNAVLGRRDAIDYSLSKTHCVFTDPQVGVVGETEKELTRAGVSFFSATYPFDDHGKAITLNRTAGFVKIIASQDDGKILGAAVVGPEGSELIHEMIVAMYYGSTVFDFIKIPHLHPTLAEIWTYPAEEIASRISEQPATATALSA